jgi:Haem-binding domain/Cytochrome P460
MAANSQFRWARLTRILAILVAGFVGAQFIRPELKNLPVTADLQAPPQVKQIITNSCYNCHSNQTNLSWFDRPVPAYWLVAMDVRQARKHVNFSEIGNLPAAQQKAVLYEAISQITLGAMPLPSYRRLHPGAAVTPDQLAVLKEYLKPAATSEPATPAGIATAEAQYDNWLQVRGSAPEVAPAPNGIAFIPEYKNWKAISSTERFDNFTIRQVLGNEVAIKAIAENHINPWPDGAAFAKLAWFEQPDGKGIVHTGAFFQVEFMVRDSKKYASTLGWGWARWRGADLKPYGKDQHFTAECVGCHSPLRKTNYVFTPPIRGQQ